jgi:hypothetical protein
MSTLGYLGGAELDARSMGRGSNRDRWFTGG